MSLPNNVCFSPCGLPAMWAIYDMIQYIYICSKPEEMASLI